MNLLTEPKTAQRGLYLHVPFCAKHCFYCDFVITTDGSPEARARFLRCLEEEIRAAAARHGRLKFDTLYLGGGTPSLLDEREMERLVALLHKTFDIAPAAEVTCEVNPGDVRREKLAAYRRLGINRVSVGAQSFDDRLLHEMGRAHDADAIRQTMQLLREERFENVSLDLILRLPDQSVENVKLSMEEALRWNPAQFVLYDLDVHEKTVYGLRQRQGRLPLPPPETHQLMFETARDMLEASGFEHYEVSSFARPGFESKHNLIYWSNGEYLGLGPGAFSYLGGCRFRHSAGVKRWFEKCESGDWQPDESEQISDKNRQIETLLTGLRLSRGIDPSAFPLLGPMLDNALRPVLEGGLVERLGTKVRLSRRGRLVAENVIGRIVTACFEKQLPA